MPTPSYIRNSANSVFYKASKREYVFFFLAGMMVLIGSWLMAASVDPTNPAAVSDFLFGAGFAGLGFFLSWVSVDRWRGLMLVIALIARLSLLGMEPGEEMSRNMWEGEILNLGYDPYALAPNAEALEPFRDGYWNGIKDVESASTQTPLSLTFFELFASVNAKSTLVKTIFIFFDLLICAILALRYGAKKAVVYAWNPLVIYSVAGMGNMDSLAILPLLGAFVIWESWVDKKGGAVVINANGGLTGGLGQMVCFAAMLAGIATALNTFFAVFVFWMTWQVLAKSGIKAGLIILVCGYAPVLLSVGWTSLSLDVDTGRLLPYVAGSASEYVSCMPGIMDSLFGGGTAHPRYFYGMVIGMVFILSCRNETMERFGNLSIGGYLLLAPMVFPSTFIWLAPFAVGASNPGFKMISLSAFVFFLGYDDSDQVWQLASWQSALLWVPFIIGLLWYTVAHRSKRSGFYVRSY